MTYFYSILDQQVAIQATVQLPFERDLVLCAMATEGWLQLSDNTSLLRIGWTKVPRSITLSTKACLPSSTLAPARPDPADWQMFPYPTEASRP